MTLLNNILEVSFSTIKRSEIMVQMSASESPPNLVKIIFAVSFFCHLSKHPMKQNFFEMVSHMNIPSATVSEV